MNDGSAILVLPGLLSVLLGGLLGFAWTFGRI
jgi:hypothetical protein